MVVVLIIYMIYALCLVSPSPCCSNYTPSSSRQQSVQHFSHLDPSPTLTTSGIQPEEKRLSSRTDFTHECICSQCLWPIDLFTSQAEKASQRSREMLDSSPHSLKLRVEFNPQPLKGLQHLQQTLIARCTIFLPRRGSVAISCHRSAAADFCAPHSVVIT